MALTDLLILCSGTVTHEATILERPMIVAYKMNAFTAWLVRKTVNPPFAALPNILAGKFIVPELIQEECTPEAVCEKALELLTCAESRYNMQMELRKVRAALGDPGSLQKAARRVVDAALGSIPKLNAANILE